MQDVKGTPISPSSLLGPISLAKVAVFGPCQRHAWTGKPGRGTFHRSTEPTARSASVTLTPAHR